MKRDAPGAMPAPIDYEDIRVLYNAARIAAAAFVATAGMIAVVRGTPAWIVAMSCAVVIMADGVWRLRRDGPADSLILLDATAVGVTLVATGDSPAIETAALVYLLTAALLLLPVRRALVAVGYGLAYAVPIAALSPVVEPAVVGTSATGRAGAALFLVLTAFLLLVARRALHRAAEAHRAAIEAERKALRIKNEFVSMVSHELRTPLTSIAGFTDTLREAWRNLEPGEVDEFLEIMRMEETHLADLVEDILVIPRLDAGQLRLEPAVLDLRELVQAAVKAVFHRPAAEVDVAVPGGVNVIADPIRLGQILRNLLENARKYGGDQVLIDGERRGDSYLVGVSDNGPGIAEADRERIFEHFEQVTKGDGRADQGVGLGLPIARRLCRAMGGDLWHEPRFPIGSRFCFTVELAPASSPSGTDVAESTQTSTARSSVSRTTDRTPTAS